MARYAITIVFETGDDTPTSEIETWAENALVQITDPADAEGERSEFETYAQGMTFGLVR